MKPLLQVCNLCKSFSGVPALSGINLDLYGGEVHAVVGENGAGKSTLIKMISGVYSIDEGEVFLNGEQLKLTNPKDGIEAGISVIHQELSVITDLSVAENIFVDNAPKKFMNQIVDFKKLYRQTEELLEETGLKLNPKEIVRNLSPAMQQMVEILRAISRNSKVIIMDEPTSSLSYEEVSILFEIIEKLKNKGIAVVYISHRMEEIFALSARITILKDGELVGTVLASETNNADLVSMMVGRELKDYYQIADEPKEKESVLEVEHLTRKGVFEDVSFTLHKGEVLGCSGLVGAGRTELVRAIFGADPIDEGSIHVKGKELKKHTTIDAIEAGIGLVPEDRRTQGILLEKNVRQNISLVNIMFNQKAGFIDFKKEKGSAEEYREKLRIKTHSLATLLKHLSGGNQQKVVLAKWLSTDVNILILDEPTRGIDVSAKREIYGHIKEFVEHEGGSVLLISSELPEIIGVCHRTLVMQEGKLMATLERNQMDEKTIMMYSTTKEDKYATV